MPSTPRTWWCCCPRWSGCSPGHPARCHPIPSPTGSACSRRSTACSPRSVGRAPVVLVLDDLHWAGRPTLALLRHLAHWGDAERVLVIGTFRDTGDEVTEPLASCLADLRRLDGIARIHLGGLDETSVEHLVASAIGQDLDAGLRRPGHHPRAAHRRERLLRRRALGPPGEHRRGPARRRPLVGAGGATRHGRPGQHPRGRGRPGGEAAPAARAVLELVAAAGHHAELRTLLLAARQGADTGSTASAIGTALDELVAAGVLVSVDGTVPGYQFGHALVRDTVEAGVAPLARARLHLRIAEALEAVYEADRRPVLAELAQQFAAGAALTGPDKAVYYCRRAAAQAMRLAAYASAISHLETALALVMPGSRSHAELLVDRGSAELRDGRYVESMQTFAAAFEGAPRPRSRRAGRPGGDRLRAGGAHAGAAGRAGRRAARAGDGDGRPGGRGPARPARGLARPRLLPRRTDRGRDSPDRAGPRAGQGLRQHRHARGRSRGGAHLHLRPAAPRRAVAGAAGAGRPQQRSLARAVRHVERAPSSRRARRSRPRPATSSPRTGLPPSGAATRPSCSSATPSTWSWRWPPGGSPRPRKPPSAPIASDRPATRRSMRGCTGCRCSPSGGSRGAWPRSRRSCGWSPARRATIRSGGRGWPPSTPSSASSTTLAASSTRWLPMRSPPSPATPSGRRAPRSSPRSASSSAKASTPPCSTRSSASSGA